MRRFEWKALSVLLGLSLVLLWYGVAALHLISPAFLPGPDRAANALIKGMTIGLLPQRTLGTIERMFFGWLLASLTGIVFGAVIGTSALARSYVAPMIEVIRPLPASALIPVTVAFFGFTDTMVLVAIGFGALWPTLLATIHGFTTLEPTLVQVTRNFDLSRWAFIRKIALPNAMPDIFAGMRISLVISLALTTVGEMMASRDGLGYWILNASRTFHSADLFAGVILFGVIGYVSGQLLLMTEKRLLRWQTRR